MTRSIKNLIAAVFIAISGYLTWTQIWPAYSVTSFLKIQIEEKNNLLASRTEIINQIERLKKESNAKYAELQRLALVVPEKRSIPEVITAVESIYSKNGFILTEFGAGDSPGTGQLAQLGFKATAQGTYNQFLTFLSYFEKNIRLFDINKIEVGLPRTAGEEGGITTDPKLGFTIDGQFYWLRPADNVSGGTGGSVTPPAPAPASSPTSASSEKKISN